MWKKILSIAGAIAVLSGLVVTSFAVNNHFAKEDAFQELVSEYRFNETMKRYHAVQERMWALENMCQKNPDACTDQIKNEIKHLKREIEELKRELNINI